MSKKARKAKPTSVIATALATVTALMAVAACGSSESSGSNKAAGPSTQSAETNGKKPILVAATMGLTGALSFYAVPYMWGVEAAIKNFNKEGGIEGRQIELAQNDDGTKLPEIVPKAEEMIAKKPAVLLMGNSDTTGIPGLRRAQAAGQLAFGTSGPTDVGATLGPLIYNDWPGDPTEAAAVAEFYQQQKWSKTILVVDEGLGYTKDICKLFDEAYTKLYPHGVVTTVTYNHETATTFPAQVSKIAANAGSASAVTLCALQTGGTAIMKELRSAGVTIPMFGFGGGVDGDYWAHEVPNLEPFYSNSIGGVNPSGGSMYANNPNTTEKEIVKQAEEEHGKPPGQGNFYVGYAAMQMLKHAIEMTKGNTESQALAEALDKFQHVETLDGYVTYTKTCHVPEGNSIAITQIVHGKGEYLKTIIPKPENVPKAPC